MKKIWIDITNSPHAILFNPIIKKLEKAGYEVIVTARDYAQTKGLLDMFGIEYHMFGKHKGKSKIKKLMGLIERSWQLYKFARKYNFDASLSMSSQYAMISSRLLRIPHMTLFDYEYTAGHHINFRLCQQILAPEGVEPGLLRKYGAKKDKVIYYSGLKEQFYIHHYMNEYKKKYKGKDPVREKLNIPTSKVLIVIRPEATVAHYQTNENPIVFELVEYLSRHKNKPIIIVLPRTKEQKKSYGEKNYKNVIIPAEVINGIELVTSADLVIGAGGTVNREAAAVGTPAYTIYHGGKLGAVDRMLIDSRRMVRIEDIYDFEKIIVEKKKNKSNPVGEDLSDYYLELVERLINSK